MTQEELMNDDAIANLKNGQIKNPNTTRLLANCSYIDVFQVK